MSDKKFLNKVKEFAEYLDHSYEADKFKLKESFSQSLLVKARIGGSQGGDCWGGRTSDYEKDSSEIRKELTSSLSYTLMNFFSDYIMVEVEPTILDHLSHLSRYDYVASVTDDYDYYGNHTEEGLYEVPVFPLMKIMLDDEHFQILKSYLSNEKKKLDTKFVDKKTEQRINELNTKIENFEKEKAKELASLKDNITSYERILASLKEKLGDFSTQKTKELKQLKSELDNLTK